MRFTLDLPIRALYLCLLASISLWLTTVIPIYWMPLCSVLTVITILNLYRYKTLITYFWGSSSTFIGLSIGIYVDLGLADISLLYSLCGSGNMLSIVPNATIGMLIGCNHGMIMSANTRIKPKGLLSCNLGMFLGMLIFDFIDQLTYIADGSIKIIGHIFLMIFFGHLFYSFSDRSHYEPAKRK